MSSALCKDASLRNLLNEVVGFADMSSFPVEFREYPPESAGMPWHVDLCMYDPPQVEAVLTVTNSNPQTSVQWKERDGTLRTMRPAENDLLLVRACQGGPAHRVTPLGKQGSRTIVKFLLTHDDAVPTVSHSRELPEVSVRKHVKGSMSGFC